VAAIARPAAAGIREIARTLASRQASISLPGKSRRFTKFIDLAFTCRLIIEYNGRL
jgi:hypothetical protein